MPPAPSSIPSRLGTQEPSSANTPDTLADDPPPYVEPLSARDVEDLVTYVREASAEPPAADEDEEEEASYWDAAAMAPFSARSLAAIARLRAYRPPPLPVWDRLPASRRAAVLLLLYADRRGELRVVVTMRAASLRNYSGHAAFPGGKADDVHETAFQIARREAWEEIGLPAVDAAIPQPFRIEPLCELPCNIAATEIVVRPCVALLHADGRRSPSADKKEDACPTVEESLIPRLDAKEVAAVFSAPFHNFLCAQDESRGRTADAPLPPGHWYDGRWIHFRDVHRWRVHNFYVPVDRQQVQRPRPETPPPAAADEVPEGAPPPAAATEAGAVAPEGNPKANAPEAPAEDPEKAGRFKVWGMTAHILVDAARIAYDEVPEIEHNPHYGDEEIIVEMDNEGRFFDKKRKAEGEAAEEGHEAKKTEAAKM
ncbi:peroxisomal coenzyme A diphosphatase [Plectosphaerella cucumerina]|uniref:Peroxisomal coenzyme A diphosphatase n=1 Tax=Plectosphaerella cucumerina TaxID=40658 RepID=A0A8K0X8P8_9PEZI|nr:peroxisomal coenzyme A diphosphatase [Plectosphaerella cucumerina]